MSDKGKKEKIEITGFFAKNNLALCEKFTQGHTDVLAQHGFLHFKSYDRYWYNLPDSYVIIAQINDVAVGGIRLEMKRDGIHLPYEKVLVRNFPEAAELNKKLDLKDLAEPCSLWNSKYVSGKNLSIFLSRASIAMSHLIGVKNIISFNATYTFRIPQDVGCVMIQSLGDNGYFNYPTDQFRAALWLHSDLELLSNADHIARDRMLSLRKQRTQSFIELYNSSPLEIIYDLQL